MTPSSRPLPPQSRSNVIALDSSPVFGSAPSHQRWSSQYSDLDAGFFQLNVGGDGSSLNLVSAAPTATNGFHSNRDDVDWSSPLAAAPPVGRAVAHAAGKARSRPSQATAGLRPHASDLGPVVVPGHSVLLRAAASDPATMDDVMCCMCSCGNVGCGVLSDVVSRAVLDIGSHDDIVGHRLNMDLPYPGIPIATSVLRQPQQYLSAPTRHGVETKGGFLIPSSNTSPTLGGGGFTHTPTSLRRGAYAGLGDEDDNVSQSGTQTSQRFEDNMTDFMSRVMRSVTSPKSPPAQPRPTRVIEPLVLGVSSGQLVSGPETLVDSPWVGRAHAAVAEHDSDEDRGPDGSSQTDDHDRSRIYGSPRAAHFAVDPWAASMRSERPLELHDFSAPAPAGHLWSAGITWRTLCCQQRCSIINACRNSVFAFGRVMRRTALPFPAWRKRLFYVVTIAHIIMMLSELALTFILVSELWCIEPVAEAGGRTRQLLASVTDEASSCTYAPIAVYLAAPPGACVLPALLGLAAVAAQSARGLRIYASWNGASLWSTSVALVLVVYHVRVLGKHMVAIPFGLMLAKLLSAQCIPTQLAEIETARVIRGWRGLFEVRNGPVERTYKELKARAV